MVFSHLLRSRRFLPLFITQFLGALNDNFFKTAVVLLVTYRTSDEWHVAPQTLVTLAGALFILPYIFFCATAGKLADKFDKARIAQIIKLCEVGFMIVGACGFLFHWMAFLFFVLFCMGAHSAFFSPVKYALLPDQLRADELMEGNAFIEAGTFISILLGTLCGGLLALRPHGEALVSCAVLAVALLGLASSRFILPAHMRDAHVHVRLNVFRDTLEILSYVFVRPLLLKTVMANSWFWFAGMTFLSLLPAFTRQTLGADEQVVTLFLTSFSVGIGAGSIACGALMGGGISMRFVPWGALGMSVFGIDLYGISPHAWLPHAGTPMPLSAFLASPHGWRMALDLFLLSFCGGFFIVPLYAVMQRESAPHYRAQVMACNNIINAFFMVASAAFALGLFALGISVAGVFLAASVLNALVGLWLFTAWRE